MANSEVFVNYDIILSNEQKFWVTLGKLSLEALVIILLMIESVFDFSEPKKPKKSHISSEVGRGQANFREKP